MLGCNELLVVFVVSVEEFTALACLGNSRINKSLTLVAALGKSACFSNRRCQFNPDLGDRSLGRFLAGLLWRSLLLIFSIDISKNQNQINYPTENINYFSLLPTPHSLLTFSWRYLIITIKLGKPRKTSETSDLPIFKSFIP